MSRALVWFRHDLRLSDHPALRDALARGYRPIPVYVHDPKAETAGAASRWWLHYSLAALRDDLRRMGSDLVTLQGEAGAALLRAAGDAGAHAVFWNRRYEPAAMARDARTKTLLRDAGLDVYSFGAALLREPWAFGKPDKGPYRVFTPFWRALQKAGPPRPPLVAPDALPPVEGDLRQRVALEALDLLPGGNWRSGFHHHWRPGEDGAWAAMDGFLEGGLPDYARDRDRPALAGTSRLSPHLHFGELTPAQVWHSAQAWSARETTGGASAAAESFLRQLAWREFAHHLLFHFPHTAEEPLDARYRAFPWAAEYGDLLKAWQRGRTGIPMVDAGMRELWASGWMHNRVRMLCASLLSKNLLVPWQEGAQWFLDTLVDADLANNSFGWQWAAGCGADAAPYFRIFNPASQGERFDGDGAYVRRWVPELGRLPAKWIHRPWAAPEKILSAAGVVLGQNYPAPVVDLGQSRRRALEAWERVKRRTA